MAAESPFTKTGNTVAVSATTSSASAAIANFPSGSGSGTIRVHNAGPALAFVRWGSGAQTAVVTTDLPIPAGAVEVFSVGTTDTVAAITVASTATVYFTPGNGQ